jgi:hypothetical protein
VHVIYFYKMCVQYTYCFSGIGLHEGPRIHFKLVIWPVKNTVRYLYVQSLYERVVAVRSKIDMGAELGTIFPISGER